MIYSDQNMLCDFISKMDVKDNIREAGKSCMDEMKNLICNNTSFSYKHLVLFGS